MTDKTKEPTMADVLAAVGAIGNRVDGAIADLGARLDAVEEKKDDKKDGEPEDKKDAFPADMKKDGEPEDKKDADPEDKKDGEPEDKKDADPEDKKDGAGCATEVAADAKKDAAEARKDAAAVRADNAKLSERIKGLEAKMPHDRSDDDHRTMTESQARCDSVAEMFGRRAPRFQSGESNSEYRRRLVREYQEHSPSWKAVDVGALADSAFVVAEEQIYNDAAAAAKNAVGVEEGGLRMVPGTTASGHKTIEFHGRPSAWMGRFGGARRYATRISPNTNKREVG